jgi:phosphoglycolate phosphatase
MKHLVIFDLDGTLVDTPSAIIEAFSVAFESMGVSSRDPAAIRGTIGLPLEEAFSRLLDLPVKDPQVATGVRQYQVAFKDVVLPRAQKIIFPGVIEGLKTLQREGFTLAIATSKFYASADLLLKSAGIRDFFAMVVGADQVKRPKPNPDSGLYILQELGIPSHCTVMVGDTTHDLLMAKAAGIRSIAVTYGIHSTEELKSAEPTWIAHSFDEVLNCLQVSFGGMQS